MLENNSIGNIEIKIFGEKSDFTLRLSKYVLVDSTGKVLEQSVIDCSFCGLFLLHVLSLPCLVFIEQSYKYFYNSVDIVSLY